MFHLSLSLWICSTCRKVYGYVPLVVKFTDKFHLSLSLRICSTCRKVYGYVPLVVNTSRSFPHSWLITGFVTRLTRQLPLVEQELLTLPEHLSSPPVFFNGVRITRSLILCVCFVKHFCPFVLFHLAIALSVFLRFTDSDYLFGIFKLFFVTPRLDTECL